MTEIKLLDTWPAPTQEATSQPENWYAEPFTKRTGCQTPGQCDDNCDCGCPYTVTDVEQLPLIETVAQIFPNEWLAFILSPEEDNDYEPTHGKLIAHSSNPDDVHDAVNTVLWNQRVYVFFNGNFNALQASYGPNWEQVQAGPHPQTPPAQPDTPKRLLPEDLIAEIYTALDQLYTPSNIHQAALRLRRARVQANVLGISTLVAALDQALQQIETPAANINTIIWHLEDALSEMESA